MPKDLKTSEHDKKKNIREENNCGPLRTALTDFWVTQTLQTLTQNI